MHSADARAAAMETARIAFAPRRAFIRRAVERDHGRIQQSLIGGIHADQLRRENALDIFNRLQHSLAQVVALVAVTKFDGLMLSGRSAAGHRGAAHRAVRQHHVRFYRRVAARVQNFARVNRRNFSHFTPCNFVL